MIYFVFKNIVYLDFIEDLGIKKNGKNFTWLTIFYGLFSNLIQMVKCRNL